MATRAAFNCPCGSFAIKNNPERRLARRRLAADDGVLSFCCGGEVRGEAGASDHVPAWVLLKEACCGRPVTELQNDRQVEGPRVRT